VSSFPLLTFIVMVPWLGALMLASMPRAHVTLVRVLSLLYSLSTLALAGVALSSFDPHAAGYQFAERHAWITALNVNYSLGLDGMSLLLVLLTGIVSPLCLLASWKSARDPRLFGSLFLLLQGAALGVFLALDFFHWFVFWEVSLVPAFFLIKMWGGPGATRAAYQFVIYTLAGGACMLLGFAALYAATGTLDFTALEKRIAALAQIAREMGRPVA
jgi:NADH-quinone oxidoreductase subunit M